MGDWENRAFSETHVALHHLTRHSSSSSDKMPTPAGGRASIRSTHSWLSTNSTCKWPHNQKEERYKSDKPSFVYILLDQQAGGAVTAASSPVASHVCPVDALTLIHILLQTEHVLGELQGKRREVAQTGQQAKRPRSCQGI